MRVFILDPSAVQFDRTHAAKSVLGHTKALRASGIEVHWITNEQSSLQDEGTRNHRIFPYTIYDDVRRKRGRIARKIRALAYRRLVSISAARLVSVMLEEGIGSQDHLFVPTTDWLLLQAIFSSFQDPRHQGRTPNLHLLVMYEQANWMTGGYPYEKIIDLLNRQNTRLFIYTETQRHARRLAKATGKRVSSYPFPCFLDVHSDSRRIDSPSICFIGGGRKDKGFQLIPGIVKKFNNSNGDDYTRFVVQAPRDEDNLENELEELRRFPNVDILGNLIDESNYRECLSKCSVLVFPYLKNVYYARGSAIVNEAVASAIPFVCTADTSLAEMIQTGNGECATSEKEFSVEIEKILNAYGSYSRNALDMASKYRDQILNSDLIRNIIRSRSEEIQTFVQPGKIDD